MKSIEHLLSLLGSQRDILTRLLELVREERSCLLHNQTQRLEQVIDEQVALLSQQRSSSMEIGKELEQFAIELHVKRELSLSQLLEQLPPAQSRRLRIPYTELTTLSTELQREGRITWRMAQQAMNYIEFALKLIGRAKIGPAPYASPLKANTRTALQVMIDNCA